MNSTQLFHQDGRPAGVFYCSQCRIVHRTEPEAEQCCAPYRCDTCGVEVERYWTQCERCRTERDAQIERERFEKAEKLTQWDGWVYAQGIGAEWFDDISELLDEYEDQGYEVPEYVWACKANHFVNADVEDLLEPIRDEAYEDFDTDDLNGLDELKAAVEKFNEANKDICSYETDHTKAVLIPKSKGTIVVAR